VPTVVVLRVHRAERAELAIKGVASKRVRSIVNLTGFDFARQARRFLRLRSRPKEPKARFVKYWRTRSIAQLRTKHDQ
jgi:hypothetical protein